MKSPDFSPFEFKVIQTCEASTEDLQSAFSLFEMNYRQANRAYLEKSLQTMRYMALAKHQGTPAGFGVGECRVMDLPRLPAQVVELAGICCIAPQFRRRGVFSVLEALALGAAEVPDHERHLTCGRVAHPAILRTIAINPTAVPRPGIQPTAWQQEVGQAIANAYGVHGFEPETFVCVGSGEPIGYPMIEVEVQPEEWKPFKAVNRDRGDSLLVMVWIPDAPPGWS
jgi:hypothetical protein